MPIDIICHKKVETFLPFDDDNNLVPFDLLLEEQRAIPCYLCGSKDIIVTGIRIDTEEVKDILHYCKCDGCGEGRWFASGEKGAIKAWNMGMWEDINSDVKTRDRLLVAREKISSIIDDAEKSINTLKQK